MRVLSTAWNAPTVYHTREDCPQLPADYRDVTEADERRRVTQCACCRELEIGDALGVD